MWNWAVLRTSISFEQLCLWRPYPNHATTVRHLQSTLLHSTTSYLPTTTTTSTSTSSLLLHASTYPLVVTSTTTVIFLPVLLLWQLPAPVPVTTTSISFTTSTSASTDIWKIQYLYILHLQSTLPPRLLHTSLLCPVPLHTSYLTCSSTTTTWTTTSDEQHVKPQNHTVIVTKLQRSIVTFSSIEDRKKEEKIRE